MGFEPVNTQICPCSWRYESQLLKIYIPLPLAHAKQEDLQSVEITTKHLYAKIKGEKEPFIDIDLNVSVITENSYWQVKSGHLLFKLRIVEDDPVFIFVAPIALNNEKCKAPLQNELALIEKIKPDIEQSRMRFAQYRQNYVDDLLTIDEGEPYTLLSPNSSAEDIYQYALTIESDLEEQLKLFAKAAKMGHVMSKLRCISIYESMARQEILNEINNKKHGNMYSYTYQDNEKSRVYSCKRIKDLHDKALKYARSAALVSSDVSACVFVASRLSKNYNVNQNCELALDYYVEAAIAGDAISMNSIADILSDNGSIAENFEKCLVWNQLGLNRGYPSCAYDLAFIYLCMNKIQKAYDYFKIANLMDPELEIPQGMLLKFSGTKGSIIEESAKENIRELAISDTGKEDTFDNIFKMLEIQDDVLQQGFGMEYMPDPFQDPFLFDSYSLYKDENNEKETNNYDSSSVWTITKYAVTIIAFAGFIYFLNSHRCS